MEELSCKIAALEAENAQLRASVEAVGARRWMLQAGVAGTVFGLLASLALWQQNTELIAKNTSLEIANAYTQEQVRYLSDQLWGQPTELTDVASWEGR